MKRHSLTLLLAGACLLAGVQTAKAQRVVLHMKGGKTFECSLSQLDSITLSLDEATPMPPPTPARQAVSSLPMRMVRP